MRKRVGDHARSRLQLLRPLATDQLQLPLDGPQAQVELRSKFRVRVAFQSATGDLPQRAVSEQTVEAAEFFLHLRGKWRCVRSRLVACRH